MSPSEKNHRDTPMMEQYRAIKKEHPGSILFFRMGDFYEMFEDDAIVAAKILNIALTSRDKKSDDPMPMCGIPYHALESYLGKMIKSGKSVAICEQIEDPRMVKGIVKRAVTRVITPGTLLDPELMEQNQSNYLCALAFSVDSTEQMKNCGLAFLELSTSDFFVMEFSGKECADLAADEIVRLSPREILIPTHLTGYKGWLRLRDKVPSFSENAMDDWIFTRDYAHGVLLDHFKTVTMEGFGLADCDHSLRAAGAVVHYLRETQKRPVTHITKIYHLDTSQYMILDRVCQRNLELVRRMMDDTSQGTLLALLDDTKTAMGARDLYRWILRPLIDKKAIDERLDAVEKARTTTVKRKDVRDLLAKMADIPRITSRVSLNIAHPKDLAALRQSLQLFPPLVKLLLAIDEGRMRKLRDKWDNIEEAFQLLHTALVDNPPQTVRDGGVIREGFNEQLDELRALKKNATSMIRDIEKREQQNSGIPKLKIKYNKVFGYFLEVSKAHIEKVPEHYMRKQTLVNSERYFTPELKEFEEKVMNAEEKILELENNLFDDLRNNIAQFDQRLLTMAGIIAEIDILLTFAEIASRLGYVRPQIAENKLLRIIRGRHPVMEVLGNHDRFVPNDTVMDGDGNKMIIITGPNMAGKSTYIRQVALLTIMAQIGSFLPVKEAQIGLVDRIFTRVGASDNLIEGKSTFMVEMVETAQILHNATPKSLVILDEIGRGTSTFDGLALAWSIAEFICRNEKVSSRTLFATHYHQLTELADILEGVSNFHVSVKEWNEEIIFLHRLVEGGSDKSYGIQVARLAGVPQEVISRAKEILTNLELTELMPARLPFGVWSGKKTDRKAQENSSQLDLFNDLLPTADPIRERLTALDINTMTPLQAFTILSELIESIND